MEDLSTDLREVKNKLDQDRPWLRLFELWLAADGSERFCFLYHDEAVVWDGRNYTPFPIVMGKTQQTTEGDLQKWPLAVPCFTPEIAEKAEVHHGFHGMRVRIIDVHKDFLDDPAFARVESAFVVEAAMEDDQFKFALGRANLTEEEVASRKINRRCDFRYKDPRTCRYAGALSSCDHSLTGANGCVVHGVDSPLHPGRYGGEPSVPRGG